MGKKILKFIANIFKWFFLGIGYISYLIYVVVKNIFFYLGFLISSIIYFLFSVITLKAFKNMKKNKMPDVKPSIGLSNNDSVNNQPNIENLKLNQLNIDMIEVESDVIDTEGNVKTLSQADGNTIVESDLAVNNVNFKAEALNTQNEGNLGYHVFVENHNISEKKQDDLLKVPEKKKQIIAEATINKTAKTEEKIFKEINEKQTFKERLAQVFPTIFEINSERKKQRELEKANEKESNDSSLVEGDLKTLEGPELGPKTVYEYTARNKDGKMEKSYYEAYSLVEVQSYLLSEGYDIYKIRTNSRINLLHRSANAKKLMKTSDLVFFLTQLSTYLKAGIPLTEAVEILSRQFKKISYQKIFRTIVNNLKSGDNFSESLEKAEGAFPKLLVNMIKTSELTGDLPETLDDMADYYDQMEKTRKQMVSALTYPTIVLVFAVAVIAFILIYVIPKFTSIYDSMPAAEIPSITRFIISASDFIKSNYYYILLGLVIILLVIKYLYSNITAARHAMQKFSMKIPVLKDVIIYNEVTTFTKTFSSLLKHGVYITDTMNILKQITNNEIYKNLIGNCIKRLRKGENVSSAFKGHWAFPVPAYEMIVTGERTGKLAEMLAKVSEYYQDLHANIVSRMKVIIEPVLIVLLTGIVGVVVLAVVVPMFSIYSSLG